MMIEKKPQLQEVHFVRLLSGRIGILKEIPDGGKYSLSNRRIYARERILHFCQTENDKIKVGEMTEEGIESRIETWMCPKPDRPLLYSGGQPFKLNGRTTRVVSVRWGYARRDNPETGYEKVMTWYYQLENIGHIFPDTREEEITSLLEKDRNNPDCKD